MKLYPNVDSGMIRAQDMYVYPYDKYDPLQLQVLYNRRYSTIRKEEPRTAYQITNSQNSRVFEVKKFEYDPSGVVSGADLENNEEEL